MSRSAFFRCAAAMCLVQGLLAAAVLPAAAQAPERGLTWGSWSMVEIQAKPVRPPATVGFTWVRWLSVKTPCGPLWGWYRQSGSALAIRIAGRGRWQAGFGSPCRGVDYQLQLSRVRSFTLTHDRLELRSGDGGTIAVLVRKR
jgi:hypothetical protein